MTHDPVKKPAHYNFSSIEVISVIKAWKPSYFLGNVIKYIARAPYKGERLQDLKKAEYYLRCEIEMVEQEEKNEDKQALDSK